MLAADRPFSDRAFALVTWGLAFHVFAMALLHGPLAVPPDRVRAVAAWKELILLPLLGVAGWRLVRRAERFRPTVPDVAVVSLAVVVLLRSLLDWAVVSVAPFSREGIYGARDLLVPFVLYGVGRTTPELLSHPRLLARLATVGLVVALIGFVERLLPIEALVLAGIPAYYRDFLNLESMTDPAFFGLPHSYFTDLGSVAFRRAGSVFLSGQSFAIALMVLLPAVQIRALGATGTPRAVRWTVFGIIWCALLLTVTRMTIIACAVQAVVVLLLLQRTLAVGALVTLGTAVAAAASVASGAVRDFIWRTLAFQTQSSASHTADWADGIVALWEHPFGAGLGTTDLTAARLGREPLTADNLLFKYAVELGWPGLLAVLVFFTGLLVLAVRVSRASEGPVRDGALLAVAITTGILVNGATGVVTNLTFLSYLWAWIAGAVVAHARPRMMPGAPAVARPMPVALDITAMHVDRGGSASHVRGLWSALQAAPVPPVAGDPQARDVVAVACPGARPPAFPRRLRDRVATVRRDLAWSLRGVERAAAQAGADLLHVPVPIGPAWGRLPLVVTVHDVFVLTHPARFRRWHRTYSAATIPPLVRRARAIIAVSEATRLDVIERLGVEPARVQVVPNGVPEAFRPVASDDPAMQAVRERLRLPPRYVVSVGQIEPRKNLERLVDAATIARATGADDLIVVHAGPAGWGTSAEAVPRAAAASRGAFRLLGSLDPDTLALVVGGATALAYPSLGEGFGMPVAEAMTAGVPVLTSHAGALRDVAGDDAEIVDPESIEAIAHGLVTLWSDGERRAALAARGIDRARRWRWTAVAAATRRVYAWARAND